MWPWKKGGSSSLDSTAMAWPRWSQPTTIEAITIAAETAAAAATASFRKERCS